MSDTLPTGDEPQETLDDPEALADELNLGIELTPEEQADAEKMVAHLKEQFALEDPAPVEPEVPAEPEVEPDPDPTDTPPATPSPQAVATSEPTSTPGVIVIDGVQVPIEEAVAYLTRREAERSRTAPEPPKPIEPPEWVDRDDPAQMGMWQELRRVEEQNKQLHANQQQFAQEQARSKAMVEVDAAMSTFRQLHPELSEDDVQTVRTHAVALNVIPGLQQGRTGTEAVLKALDLAYWDHPEFRARATAAPSPKAEKQAKAAERKANLNALGGSSGSVPRREAQPDLSTDAGAKAAAAAWLKDQNIL